MKKVIAYAGSLALALSVNVAAPSAAFAAKGGNSGIADFCNSRPDEDPLSVGTCVNLLKSLVNDGVLDAHSLCMIIKDQGNLSKDSPLRNLGQCMQIFGGL